MRYFLTLSYHGGAYHGWQEQPNALTVQQVLNQAMRTILRTPIETIGSGRTDAGVHAQVQVVHFDIEQHLTKDVLRKLNSILPHDIAVHDLRRVNDDVSARYNATSRSYFYRIVKKKNPFEEGLAYQFSRPLDIEVMNECGRIAVYWTDFQSFSKVHTDVHTFDCSVTEARWTEYNEYYIFSVSANRFLRGMVRALVGTMMLAGEGKLTPLGFREILEARDRTRAGRSVPAHGLYLSDVKYPEEIYL